jgi:hypothetical protein
MPKYLPAKTWSTLSILLPTLNSAYNSGWKCPKLKILSVLGASLCGCACRESRRREIARKDFFKYIKLNDSNV